MRDWNCSHLVLWHPTIKRNLLKTGALEVAYESHNRLFSVLRLTDHQPAWIDFARPVDGLQVLNVADRRLAFRFRNPHSGNGAVIKVSYHPLWSVILNGEERPIDQDRQMIRVNDLPHGNVSLELVFNPALGRRTR